MKTLVKFTILALSFNIALAEENKTPLLNCNKGYVLLGFELDDGKAINIRVLKSVPPITFDTAAINILKKEDFTGMNLPPVKMYTKGYDFAPQKSCMPNAL